LDHHLLRSDGPPLSGTCQWPMNRWASTHQSVALGGPVQLVIDQCSTHADEARSGVADCHPMWNSLTPTVGWLPTQPQILLSLESDRSGVTYGHPGQLAGSQSGYSWRPDDPPSPQSVWGAHKNSLPRVSGWFDSPNLASQTMRFPRWSDAHSEHP